MQYSVASRTGDRPPRNVIGTLAIVLGAIVATLGMSAGTVAGVEPVATQTVALHNLGAPTENTNECPNATDDFWHFVIAPNGDTHAFVSITLNLDGASKTFAGADIIPNKGQTDNVYVKVPGGYDFDDLRLTGSSAHISPATGSVMFVLSHFCDGPGTTTTSSSSIPDDDTTTSSSSSIPDDDTTTSSSSSIPDDDTTTSSSSIPDDDTTTTTTAEVGQQGPTTTTLDSGPTTTDDPTTTVVVGQAGPTTTAASGAGGPTTLAAELPQTGADANATMLVLGGLLVMLGAVLLLTTRRPATN